MTSWLTWPVEWLAKQISHQRAKELEKKLGDARYIDADEWAKLNGISKQQAAEDLDSAVTAGVLEKMYLYEGHDSPVTFLFPEDMLGKPIKLSEIGYLDEDEDREVVASRLQSRLVYVATGGADHYVHAAA